MQLILEPESTSIDIKEKMSVEKEPLSEKIIANGNLIIDNQLSNGKKVNILTKTNSTDDASENLEQIRNEFTPTTPTAAEDALSTEHDVSTQDSSTNNVTSEILCEKNPISSNGKDGEESQNDIQEIAVNVEKEESACVDSGKENTYVDETMEACEETESSVVVHKEQDVEMEVCEDKVNDIIVNREQDGNIHESMEECEEKVSHVIANNENVGHIDEAMDVCEEQIRDVTPSQQEQDPQAPDTLETRISEQDQGIGIVKECDSDKKSPQGENLEKDVDFESQISTNENNVLNEKEINAKKDSTPAETSAELKLCEANKPHVNEDCTLVKTVMDCDNERITPTAFIEPESCEAKPHVNKDCTSVKTVMDCDNETDTPTATLGVKPNYNETDTPAFKTNSEIIAPELDNKEIATNKNVAQSPANIPLDNERKNDVPVQNVTDSATKSEDIIQEIDNVVSEINLSKEIYNVQNIAAVDDDTNEKPVETVVVIESKNLVPDVLDNDLTGSVKSPKGNIVHDALTCESKDEILDVDEIKVIEGKLQKPLPSPKSPQQEKMAEKKLLPTIRLSNTLDILSDDDDEPTKIEESVNVAKDSEKQCINIDDDDDIMLIDEDTITKDDKNETPKEVAKTEKVDDELQSEQSIVKLHDNLKENETCNIPASNEKESTIADAGAKDSPTQSEIKDKTIENEVEKVEKAKPLVSDNFIKTYKKNLSDMTKDDLEEFCILKIVESLIDRSNLTEMRTTLKTLTRNIDDFKKKTMMLTKQNRDLQVVLKSVQEEQKKNGNMPIAPLKITRSVGMQVLMTEKSRRKGFPGPPSAMNTVTNNINNRQTRNTANQNQRQQTQSNNNTQQIPVPRLVPATAANSAVMKSPNVPPVNSAKTPGKTASPLPNGVRNSPPVPKAEKRPHNKMLTVDLTDDEPPTKVVTKNPTPPVRLVPPQNLIAPRQQVPQAVGSSPRKVYIPISTQGQNVRPGQTIMLRSVPSAGPRQRAPMGSMVRIPQNAVRMARTQSGRHPAPLPDAMKQYQPPNWKALPPAPDLKLSKVENGIVISWKIEGYQEDSYEEIASYQLYAYQETSSPPSTSLWKKIGDVKALPLPMACTLTQFMAGYKYYFAVRAVDVKSRLGPFSLPGSILLLNKM